MRRLAVVAVAVASFGSVVACGGETTSGAKARYIEQGDAICGDALNKVNAAGTGTDTATLEKVRDAWNNAYNQINELPKPNQSFELANAFTTDMHNLALTAEAAVQSSMVPGLEARAQQRVTDLADQRERVAKTAEEFGFKTCSDI